MVSAAALLRELLGYGDGRLHRPLLVPQRAGEPPRDVVREGIQGNNWRGMHTEDSGAGGWGIAKAWNDVGTRTGNLGPWR